MASIEDNDMYIILVKMTYYNPLTQMIKLGIILVSLIFIQLSLNKTQRLLQAAQRSSSVSKLCKKFESKDKIIEVIQKSKQQASGYESYISKTFKMSGNDLINSIIQEQSMGNFMSKLSSMSAQIALYVGPFALPIIVNLLMWPFLLCCCCCPKDCPPKCCKKSQYKQKQQQQHYTKLQIILPAIFLITVFILVAVSSALGLKRSAEIEQNYYIVGCSVAHALDNIANGNYSSQYQYWSGLNSIDSGLNNIKMSLPGIKTQLQKVRYTNGSSPVKTTYQQGLILLQSLSKIPDGNAGGIMPGYHYAHFDGSAGNVQSLFPALIGKSNDGSTYVGKSYSSINSYNQYLKLQAENAQKFLAESDTSISTSIDQLLAPIKPIKQLINLVDSSLSIFSQLFAPSFKIITIVLYSLFAVCIGLAIIGIISLLPVIICDVYSCRHLLYTIFPIVSLLATITLIVAASLSATTPTIYLSCDFISFTISSSQLFSKNLGPLLGSQTVKSLSACMVGGSGDFINQFDGVNLTSINALISCSLLIVQFKALQAKSIVQNSLNSIQNQIEKYYYTQKYDFNSSLDMDVIKKISNGNNYGSCTTNSFKQDSWVSSLSQSSIPCVGTVSTASSSQCPNSIAITTGRGNSAASLGCFGCMDTTRVLLNSGDPVTDISARYGSTGDCGLWTQDLTNLWNNYYSIKATKIAPLRTRMADTKATYLTHSSGYRDRLETLQLSMASIKQSLTSISSIVFNPQYGIIAGLNCQVIGEDLQIVADSICKSLFGILNYYHIIFGICSYGLAFSTCCITYTGTKMYKRSKSMVQVSSYQIANSYIEELNQDPSLVSIKIKKSDHQQN